MSQQRRKNTLVKVALAWAILVFLVAVVFTDWPGTPAPLAPVTTQPEYIWQCPEKFERVVARHRDLVELEWIADASTELLQMFYRELCATLQMRDEIVFSAAFERIPEYMEQHARLRSLQSTLGYPEAEDRQPSYSPAATGIWFTLLVMAQSMAPVTFHWVECELENPADGDQCWRSQTMVGEIQVSAELYGPFSSLRVELPTYTFHRVCDGVRPETSFLLWECPIDSVHYHPDGWSAECPPLFATWSRTGRLTFFQPDDGPFCPEDEPLPPAQVEPEWPDQEKSPAPTPMPDGWFHL